MTSNAPKQGACLLTTRIFTKMRKKTRTRDRGMLLALLSNYTCLSWPATATLTVSPSLLAGVHMRAKSSDGLRRCLWNNRRNFVYLETAPECGRGPPGSATVADLPWSWAPHAGSSQQQVDRAAQPHCLCGEGVYSSFSTLASGRTQPADKDAHFFQDLFGNHFEPQGTDTPSNCFS